MEQLEEFLRLSYDKAVMFLHASWQETLDGVYGFDYMMLVKSGSIVLMGYFLAKFLSKYTPNLVRDTAKQFKITIDTDFTKALRTFIFQLVFFLFVLIAIISLELSDNVAFIASSLVKSLLLLSFVAFALRCVKLLLYRMANTPREEGADTVHVVQESTLPLFENTALIIFAIAGLYQVFAIWNVDMTALLAGAGIGAMAIGMAAKDTLSDVIAGILILTDAPYRVGDVVYVRNDLKGRVSQIGLRNTRIVTRNNVEVIVPNTIMGTSQIVNESSSKEEGIRISIDISVSNKEDVAAVKSYLLKAVEASREVNQAKKKKAIMTGFEMDMLQFRVQCWIDDPEKKGDAKAELMENVYLVFREVDIDVTLRRYQHIKVAHEDAQELRITEFPQTSSRGELYIKEFPETKQEQYVREMPETKQEQVVYVKEFPKTEQEVHVQSFPQTKHEVEITRMPEGHNRQEVHIKEVPNLFGNGPIKKLTKVGKSPFKPKDENEK